MFFKIQQLENVVPQLAKQVIWVLAGILCHSCSLVPSD
jgi:hypothetical protein